MEKYKHLYGNSFLSLWVIGNGYTDCVLYNSKDFFTWEPLNMLDKYKW